MTPDEIRKFNTRPFDLVAANSKCQCHGKGVVPCLRHHRTAFSVYFVAKHGVAQLARVWAKTRGGGGEEQRGYRWRPLECTVIDGLNPTGQFSRQDEELLLRLGLPWSIEYSAQNWGWAFYGKTERNLVASGKSLYDVARRFAQRSHRAKWPNKGYR